MKIFICMTIALALCAMALAADADIAPLAISVRAIGGGQLNTYTLGVQNGVGLNNIGLLVRTWGKVTYVDTSNPSMFFYIDDGSNRSDGSPYTGVRVALDNLAAGDTIAPPATNDIVAVTGISSTFMVGANVQSNLRPRRQSDITDFFHP
jgi:hypothetical protein